MGSIFISYRRSDSAGESGRLSDDLIARFGSKAVFMDVDAILPGRDFRKAIHENVGGCSVFLAMIGSEWLGATSTTGQRRLDNENDYVRLEIAAALRRDIPVIPVLVRGAHMPKFNELPEEIRDLAYRNSMELTHSRWKSDVQVLGNALAPYLEDASAAPAVAPKLAPAAAHIPAPAASVAASASVDAAALDRVAKQLANFIGPIAEVVVRRASRRCVSLADLCNTVSQEIDVSADRAKFLASCRH